ncbi:MAG: hypothetical protein ACI8W8_004531, partial [Rhodothermales bacterium]
NLVGIPFTPDDVDPRSLGSFVNDLDAPAAALEAGQAYWVFASEASTRILTGLRTPQPRVSTGWSLYAPVSDSGIPTDAIAWTYQDGIWLQADAPLQPGTGYLLFQEQSRSPASRQQD